MGPGLVVVRNMEPSNKLRKLADIRYTLVATIRIFVHTDIKERQHCDEAIWPNKPIEVSILPCHHAVVVIAIPFWLPR